MTEFRIRMPAMLFLSVQADDEEAALAQVAPIAEKADLGLDIHSDQLFDSQRGTLASEVVVYVDPERACQECRVTEQRTENEDEENLL